MPQFPMQICSFFRVWPSSSPSSQFISRFPSSKQKRGSEGILVKKTANNRRALRRNKIKNRKSKNELKLLGVNAAGLSSKFKSFDKLLTDISPQIFFIQESKMKRPGRIKTKMSNNYVIYELTRKNKAGGGLAIGVIKELPSVWIE